jgi:chromosomal replication initiation ATPase DnaA
MGNVDVSEILKGIEGTAIAARETPGLQPCGTQFLGDGRDLASGGQDYCDGLRHYFADRDGRPWATKRCPLVRRDEIRARISDEATRLEGVLEEVGRLTGLGFSGFIRGRHPKIDEALDVMRTFARGRPPKRGVMLSGSTGLGKSRLLLASHFELLNAGVDSEYVTAAQLRELFHDAENFDDEVSRPAKDRMMLLSRAEVLHLDDLGDIEDDDRKRGQFKGGLKALLDQRRGVWAVATNLTWQEAERHPEVGTKALSRLVANATVVKIEGADFRVEFGR